MQTFDPYHVSALGVWLSRGGLAVAAVIVVGVFSKGVATPALGWERAAGPQITASETTNTDDAKEVLDRVQTALDKLLAEYPNSAAAYAAYGNLELARGKQLRPPGAERLPEARSVLMKAELRFGRAVHLLHTQLANPPAVEADRQAIEEEYLDARFSLASTAFQVGRTYPARGSARAAAFATAIKWFDSIFQQYRATRAGLYAHLWHAKSLEQLEDLPTALEVYDELLMHAPEGVEEPSDKALDGFFAEVREARLRIKDGQKNVSLATWPAFGGPAGFDSRVLGSPLAVAPAGVVGRVASMGFASRSPKMRKALSATFGGTKEAEQAVTAGLDWIARHQNPNGSWSLNFDGRCQGVACGGSGSTQSDTAATALALLPFLAAGRTHETRSPHQKAIHGGLYWLLKNQDPNGNLAKGSVSSMYSHGLASIVLCEAYGLSQDRLIGAAAQAALKFIEEAQDKTGGGWRYTPGQPGDLSVAGWQLLALKTGQAVGLNVDPANLEGARKFLDSCAKGTDKGTFSYMPESGAAPTMSAVGLLCRQTMGMSREDGAMTEGLGYLMRNIPRPQIKNSYYWYYATQVMHNLPGPEWDRWNRTTRRILIDTQVKEGCAAGSWDPDGHAWGQASGRMMVTSLSLLTLQVHYRYAPVYATHAIPAEPAVDPKRTAD